MEQVNLEVFRFTVAERKASELLRRQQASKLG
ncbi:hypothetical protein SAMN06297280_3405 [Arsukibacterium tuosuense]|uniref:Uncharacterized protein n=1 Tax=Arsukibacterium tuosuense TaxID=1323745 RepID=A0A285JF45_9GAMM|nr:hypothetical protein SAMN06297280_3405 [Arsukibacterium tuosuense]